MVSGIQHFIQTVQRMQWSDYLDILVVAFLLYSLLPHLRTPNIKKIVRTVGALVLIAWMTDIMQLHTLNWILSQLLTVGLVAFVVLFQPELRYMLNHLGDLKIGQLFGFSRPVQEMEVIIRQTAMACEIMSGGVKMKTEEDKQKLHAVIIVSQDHQKAGTIQDGIQTNITEIDQHHKNLSVNNAIFHDGAVVIEDGKLVAAHKDKEEEKIGALIVFSRSNQLDEYFKTGTVINGKVTEQLLRNIFVNKAPLHDGAVIIQSGRIAAAGCVLPVSNSTSLPKDLGTRHRAAVGISEVSNAVAVVVSEETGGISVAIGGVLKRDLTRETLEKLLINELCPQDENNKNWLEKVIDRITALGKEAIGNDQK